MNILNEADKLLEDSHDRHFHTVYDYLLGKETDPNQLWSSVGYFLHGRGRHASIKPWRNEEQREELKRVTGREQ